jgi:hypothetical protein
MSTSYSTFALKRFDISPEKLIVQELFSIKTLKTITAFTILYVLHFIVERKFIGA